MQKYLSIFLVTIFSFLIPNANSQSYKNHRHKICQKHAKKIHVRYGVASFYDKKFNKRKMANGEVYEAQKYTAACNVFALNTWIKVTNLKNNRSVIVKIKDRMNKKNKRLVDLSYSAAKKLGYLSRGLTRVKIELLNNYTQPKNE